VQGVDGIDGAFAEAARGTPLLLYYATAFRYEADAYMFCSCFFVFFFVYFPSTKNMRQPFSGTAERIFMKLSPNDRGGNVV